MKGKKKEVIEVLEIKNIIYEVKKITVNGLNKENPAEGRHGKLIVISKQIP